MYDLNNNNNNQQQQQKKPKKICSTTITSTKIFIHNNNNNRIRTTTLVLNNNNNLYKFKEKIIRLIKLQMTLGNRQQEQRQQQYSGSQTVGNVIVFECHEDEMSNVKTFIR